MAESQDQRTEGGAQALALSLQGLHAWYGESLSLIHI